MCSYQKRGHKQTFGGDKTFIAFTVAFVYECMHMSKLKPLYTLIMCSFSYINYISMKQTKKDQKNLTS